MSDILSQIGAELDAIFKPGWLNVVHNIEALATNLEGDLKNQIATFQGTLATSLQSTATAITNAEAQVTTTVNPIVNDGITALSDALGSSYPPIKPLLTAVDQPVEKLADGGTDAILLVLMQRLAGFLTATGKTVALAKLPTVLGG